PGMAACSIECFLRQTWPERELVILDDGESDALAEHVGALGDPRVRLLRLPHERLPLGALRNRAVAEARGTLVCQWDDDDLSDPERISRQAAAMQAVRADACVLHRETLWWPHRERVATSMARLWESSLLVRRSMMPRYPALRRGEDTPVVESLARRRRVAVLDEPHLQTYVVHERNTFPAEHFERHWLRASDRREGPREAVWRRHRSEALPLARFREAVGASGAPAVTVEGPRPRVLVLTPMKDAAAHLDRYLELLSRLDWPRDHLALGILESDSRDDTLALLGQRRPWLEARFSRMEMWKEDFGFHPAVPRWDPSIQRQRRSILARSRNRLLAHALDPAAAWVLWLDADLADLPADLIQRLLAPGKDVTVPHVVSAGTGETFDLNTWRLRPGSPPDWRPHIIDGLLQPPRGLGRQYLGELGAEPIVEVDAVGGCALLVRADLHRAGVDFPESPVEGLIETEGLAVLARRHGSACYGLPQLTVVHT
ncbi:MAG TPA: glycosyltransferase family 2 protein, partial [Polyangia bacterium]|nr:glycosyltransferase family 2 protein [Polyangia bacterium]